MNLALHPSPRRRYVTGSFPAVLVVLFLAAILSARWSHRVMAHDETTFARQSVPVSFDIGERRFGSYDLHLTPRTLMLLETKDYVYRRYINADLGETVDLLIVFSANNRKGIHPPEVCLEAGGGNIIESNVRRLRFPKTGEIELRELVIQEDNRITYHLYVYKCGDDYTADFLKQQMMGFLQGVRSRTNTGALIRFSVPVRRQIDEARQLALSSAAKLIPQISAKLP